MADKSKGHDVQAQIERLREKNEAHKTEITSRLQEIANRPDMQSKVQAISSQQDSKTRRDDLDAGRNRFGHAAPSFQDMRKKSPDGKTRTPPLGHEAGRTSPARDSGASRPPAPDRGVGSQERKRSPGHTVPEVRFQAADSAPAPRVRAGTEVSFASSSESPNTSQSTKREYGHAITDSSLVSKSIRPRTRKTVDFIDTPSRSAVSTRSTGPTSFQSQSKRSLQSSKELDPKIIEMQFNKEIYVALSAFEKAGEWADLSATLGRISKSLTALPLSYSLASFPNDRVFYRRLAQCLHRSLPSGVHLRVCEIYDQLLVRQEEAAIMNNLGMFTIGIFPVLQYASAAVRRAFFKVMTVRLLPLGKRLAPVLVGLLLALLPCVEDDKAPTYEAAVDLIFEFQCVGRGNFMSALWLIVMRSDRCRISAFEMLGKALDRAMQGEASPRNDASAPSMSPRSDISSDSRRRARTSSPRSFIDKSPKDGGGSSRASRNNGGVGGTAALRGRSMPGKRRSSHDAGRRGSP